MIPRPGSGSKLWVQASTPVLPSVPGRHPAEARLAEAEAVRPEPEPQPCMTSLEAINDPQNRGRVWRFPCRAKEKFLLSNRTQIPALDGWTGAESQEFAEETLGLPRVGGAHLLMTQRQ